MNLKYLKTVYEQKEAAIRKLKSSFPHLSDMSKETLLAYFDCTSPSELIDISHALARTIDKTNKLSEENFCRCIDSNGIPKLLYATPNEAERIERYVIQKRGILLKIYPCPHVKGWHLSKNKG